MLRLSVLLIGSVPLTASSVVLTQPAPVAQQLNVTADYFSEFGMPAFNRFLKAPLEDGALPEGLKYLEVGSMEGLSARWLGENLISKSPGGQLTCIDLFGDLEHHTEYYTSITGNMEARFDANTAHLVTAGLLVKLKGLSRVEMARLLSSGHEGTFDFVYVDGSHVAMDVLGDAVLAFWLVKPNGGIIAFDDYQWQDTREGTAKQLPPGPAIDSFLSIFAEGLEVLERYLRDS